MRIKFITGIVFALVGAAIMFHGNAFGNKNTSVAIIIGIIGLTLIATSKRK